MDRWIVLDLMRPWPQLKPIGGCYVVISEDRVIYVGQSSDIRKRLANHDIHPSYGSSWITPWGAFNDLVVKLKYPRRYGAWAMIELRLIRRLRPTFNKVGRIPCLT